MGGGGAFPRISEFGKDVRESRSVMGKCVGNRWSVRVLGISPRQGWWASAIGKGVGKRSRVRGVGNQCPVKVLGKRALGKGFEIRWSIRVLGINTGKVALPGFKQGF